MVDNEEKQSKKKTKRVIMLLIFIIIVILIGLIIKLCADSFNFDLDPISSPKEFGTYYDILKKYEGKNITKVIMKYYLAHIE